MPGGKVDPGESNVQAMVREALEETGLQLRETNLQPLYCGPCFGKDGQDFWVTTYLSGVLIDQKATACEEGFQIRAMEFDALCHSNTSPYSAYNRRVRAAWRAFFG